MQERINILYWKEKAGREAGLFYLLVIRKIFLPFILNPKSVSSLLVLAALANHFAPNIYAYASLFLPCFFVYGYVDGSAKCPKHKLEAG